mmetsp:Transcript_6058/g.9030  ORF Transcript_6058/g.9030 Transcript_6058/m.9030 type:complete len:182 (+) Transcript_6058:78-623(+)
MFLVDWLTTLLRLLGLSSKKARIIILGLDNAGKSTLLHKLCSNEVRAFVPTTKAHAKTFSLGSITFTAWDLGGHEQVRDLWEEYYSGADAIVFMVDSADHERFDESKNEMLQLLAADNLMDIPVLVLANKNDMPNSAGKLELSESLGLRDADENRDIDIFSCSVLHGTGYVEAFRWLSARL